MAVVKGKVGRAVGGKEDGETHGDSCFGGIFGGAGCFSGSPVRFRKRAEKPVGFGIVGQVFSGEGGVVPCQFRIFGNTFAERIPFCKGKRGQAVSLHGRLAV